MTNKQLLIAALAVFLLGGALASISFAMGYEIKASNYKEGCIYVADKEGRLTLIDSVGSAGDHGEAGESYSESISSEDMPD